MIPKRGGKICFLTNHNSTNISGKTDIHSEDVSSFVKEFLENPKYGEVYNLGGGNLNASTMLKVLNAGQYEEVPAQMMRWNKAGGKVLEGLTRRRQAEANLFMGKEWKE